MSDSRYLLDTSVLIADEEIDDEEIDGVHCAISVVSLAELQFGVLVAKDDQARAARLSRLAAVTAAFPSPIHVDHEIAREWGSLQAAVKQRGGAPRARPADLVLAATARLHQAIVATRNPRDLALIADLVPVAVPDDKAGWRIIASSWQPRRH